MPGSSQKLRSSTYVAAIIAVIQLGFVGVQAQTRPKCFFLECGPGDASSPVRATAVESNDNVQAEGGPRELPRPHASREVCQSEDGTAFCASSVLDPQYGFNYLPANMLDGRLDTAWVEGANGDGIREWVVADFGENRTVSGFEIINGYHKNRDIFLKNNRIRQLKVVLSNGFAQDLTLADAAGPQRFSFRKAVEASWVQLKILSVYNGNKYADTAISELRILTE